MKFKEYLTKDNLKNTIRQYKGFGFLVSIILIILSILMFIFPSLFSYLSIWIFVIGLTFAGFFDFIAYFFGNKDKRRQPYLLFKGTFNLIISLLILIPLIINSIELGFKEAIIISTNGMLYYVIIFLGIYLLINGFIKILKSRYVFLLGGNRIIEIIIGILYIIIGILIMCFPISLSITYLNYILAIYILIYGIILFIELLTSPIVKDYSKVINVKEAKKNSKNEEITGEVIDIDEMSK